MVGLSVFVAFELPVILAKYVLGFWKLESKRF